MGTAILVTVAAKGPNTIPPAMLLNKASLTPMRFPNRQEIANVLMTLELMAKNTLIKASCQTKMRASDDEDEVFRLKKAELVANDMNRKKAPSADTKTDRGELLN